MKKSRLPLIIFSMVAALAAGAILVGAASYFALAADASPTGAQAVPQVNQLDVAAPNQVDQNSVIAPNPVNQTGPAASGQFVVPDSQKPSALDQIQVTKREGGEGAEHERYEHESGGDDD